MKVLLVTLSDNEVHQDMVFSMFENLYGNTDFETWVMGIDTPKVSVKDTPHTHLVKCPKRPGIEKDTFNFIELFSIIRWIKRQHFDVIFFETLHVWNLAIMITCHKKTKLFQMIHDVIPHEGDKQEKVVNLMNAAVCKLADHIVICNRKYISIITEKYKVAHERVHSIDMWRRFPEYSVPRYTKHVLFFGRLNPYKGTNNLLEIAKGCPDIHFDVIGRVDSQVQNIVDELKMLSNVYVNNEYVSNEEMTEAFVNADWIILPYNSATQSGVVIDGYRFGRPSIAFDVGALSEQISDGNSGYLIEEGNIQAFINKLYEAVNMDKEKYTHLSQESYKYGIEKYSAEGAVNRFLALIKQ